MADFRKVLKQVRDYEIRIRRAVNTHMHGNFASVFKGSGLEFEDVRQYQFGDDIRHIDWNTTAKGHGTFVKTYREEKEQFVFFVLDISASKDIGRRGYSKLDLATETCGTLALSAVKEGSQVGLLTVTDQKETYIKPGKGKKHAFHILKSALNAQRQHKTTNLAKALKLTAQILKKRAIVFILSDFIDMGYEDSLKRLSRRHDVIALHIGDRQESRLPSVGMVPMVDAESGKRTWVNTLFNAAYKDLSKQYHTQHQALQKLCQRNAIDYLALNTDSKLVDELIGLFRVRKFRK